MTEIIKIKVTPKSTIKGKMDVRFPASVSAVAPVLLDRTGGNYAISIDVNALTSNIASGLSIDGSQILSGTISAARLPTSSNITWSGTQKFSSAAGIYLGTGSNIQLFPGDPAAGPGGNAFNGGIITHNVTGNYQVSAYQVVPTSGTVPDWGPISEFVSRRVEGTNFQRISFTSMAAWAGPSLTDAATDYRIQAESGGAATLLPIKFTQQQNALGSYYEYLTLAPGNDGNVRMFRRTDSPGLTANNLSLTLGQQKRTNSNVLTATGTQNSPQFILEGNSFDSALHTASLRQYVEMTSNAGAATWHLQYALDAGGYGDILSATSTGIVAVGSINATTLRATTHGVYGATSGNVDIVVPAVAGSNTLTLPAGTTNFSATGGTSQVVKQTSVGGAFTVGQLAASDLSNGTTGSGGAVVLATAPVLTTPQIAGSSSPIGAGMFGFAAGTMNYGDGAANHTLLSTDQAQPITSKLSVLVSSPTGGGMGYSTGAGGTIAQATSKSTGVTLSKTCGAITMNNAALGAGTIVSFVLTNTAIAATDVLILNHISGGTLGSYLLNAACAAGTATIYVRNETAGSLSEAIVIQFVVIKAANA